MFSNSLGHVDLSWLTKDQHGIIVILSVSQINSNSTVNSINYLRRPREFSVEFCSMCSYL
ncbi:hypothetical protein VCHA51O444_30256 [Vibrio chagasii]|nr:hypothetical protein VCHA51O444_30256 [Vibrio chagasii]CAH7400184.1 hypothetical protein VCHA53O474_40239 [Vibrio chagasii]